MRTLAIVLIIVSTIIFVSAAFGVKRANINQQENPIIYVGPVTIECSTPNQRCLQTKFSDQDPYEPFFGTIDGFEFEPGYDYKLIVTSSNSSSAEYTLVDVVSKEPANYIMITSPVDKDQIDTSRSIEVTGEARGLFEGNVVIEARDTDENVLAQTFTTLAVPNMGDFGQWEATLAFPQMPNYAEGKLVAFSPSPAPEEMETQEIAYSIPVVFIRTTSPIVQTPAQSGNPNNSALIGIQWDLIEYLSSQGTYVASIPNSGAYIMFDETETSGSTGCNTFTGSYTTDGDAIKIGPVAGTRRACPEELNEQEASTFTNLDTASYYSLEESYLTLKDDAGLTLMVYRMSEP